MYINEDFLKKKEEIGSNPQILTLILLLLFYNRKYMAFIGALFHNIIIVLLFLSTIAATIAFYFAKNRNLDPKIQNTIGTITFFLYIALITSSIIFYFYLLIK